MLMLALIVNVSVLVPLVLALAVNSAGIDAHFGGVTDARRILTCVYAAIAVVSAGLIGLHVSGHVWAVPMTMALFAVQIAYKLSTAFVIGLGSPVVLTNLAIVALQVVALAVVAAQL